MKSILRMLRSTFCFPKADYERIKDRAWAENMTHLRIFSAIACFAFFWMALTSLKMEVIGGNFWLYTVYAVLMVPLFALAMWKRAPQRVQAVAVYLFFAALLLFGTILGTMLAPDELTVSYIVMLVLVPLVLTARASVMNTISVVSMVVYIVLAKRTQPEAVFDVNLLSVVPYGCVSLAVTALMMRAKMQRLLYRDEVGNLERTERAARTKLENHETFIADMVRYVSSAEEPEKVLMQLLTYIGKTLGADRAYVFEENAEGSFDNTYEWCRDGVSAEKDNLQGLPYDGVIDMWYEQYKSNRYVVIRDLEEYRSVSQGMYDVLKPQGIVTLVTGPLIIDGRMIGFYGVDNPPLDVIDDIAELLRVIEFSVSFMVRMRDNAFALAYAATHDQLTGCGNRKALDETLAKELSPERSIGIAMCDLNGLKRINDDAGHAAGDAYIVRASETLRSVFGRERVYRLGGDEFAAVLTGFSEEAFTRMADDARGLLGTTAALGTVWCAGAPGEFDEILKRADTAMYEQKHEYYVAGGHDRRRR
ncbi:MAG: sensor domain-containing diguanylate cyclase [Clostridia bacterium]|nr:sensor domain-containing diguanylate cyclase [Clostridia bacterium]